MGELCPIVPHWGSSFIRCGSLKFQKRCQLFIRRAQRNAFRRRGARQQSRSFVPENPRLRLGRIRRFYCGRIWIPAFNDRSDKRNPSFRLMLYRKRHCPLPKRISYVFGKFCLRYGFGFEIGAVMSLPSMLKKFL